MRAGPLLATALAACSPAPKGPSEVALDGFFSGGREQIETGWEDSPGRLDPAACAECHAAAHGEWREGAHARAWTSRSFQRAYALEPRRWCRGCHAPLAAQEESPALRDTGIGCAVCHVRDGTIVSRTPAASASPHRTAVLPELGNARFCSGCHQFNFPRSLHPEVEYSEQPMQNTYAEWQRAGAAECETCHLRGHRLLGPSDPEWVRQLVRGAEIDDSESGTLSLRLALAPRGHRMPTGDLFRSLELEVARDAAFEDVIARRRYGRVLGPGFVGPFEVSSRADVIDTTVSPRRDALHLTVDRPDDGRAFMRLRYHFHDPTTTTDARGKPVGSTEIWSSEVSPGI